MQIKEISLDEDYEPVYALTRKNTNTGLDEPASGLTGVLSLFSATRGGTTIHADVSISLAERASTPGEYFGIHQGDTLRLRLAAYIDKVIWERVGDGTNITEWYR